MKKITTVTDILTTKLEALYDIENEILKALPKMADGANNKNLKEAFKEHLEETEKHVTRLEEAFRILDIKPKKLKVEAIRGLADDTKWILGEKPEPGALDALLIASASYVEHYEIAGYTVAKRWADLLDNAEISDLLQQTLDEEMAADEKLTLLAEEEIEPELERA